MAYAGGLDLQMLAKLNGIDLTAAAGPSALAARALDADGDGRPDLYLVDADGDGSVDGVVRAVDTDGDGLNDTFVLYDEAGQVASVGRADPATGEIEIADPAAGGFDEIAAGLGIPHLEAPEEALFTSFGDPYVLETYGSPGEDVPDVLAASGVDASAEAEPEPPIVEDLSVSDIDEGGAAEADDGDTLQSEPPEVVPRIVEIEDRSGGAGSSLWAGVDADADGLADHEVRIDKTSMGTYYGDIDKDGYSEDVATDRDLDGRIDTVDTTGQGSSADTVAAGQVVDPADDHLVDHGSDDVGAEDAGSRLGDDSGVDGYGTDDDSGGPGDTPADADDGYDSGGSSSDPDDGTV